VKAIRGPIAADISADTAAEATAALEADGLDERLAALQRLGEATGKEILAEVVEEFLARGAAALEAMHSAIARADGEAVADAAHALRGSSGVLGAAALATACAALEGSAREGDLDACAARLAAVEQEYQTIGKRLAP
jgi:HPt (histidine-containing phosphotransfer) domain-containing protein